MVVTAGGEIILRWTRAGTPWCALDGISWPVIGDRLFFNAWNMVSRNGRELFLQSNFKGSAAAVIQLNGTINVAFTNNAAPASWRHDPANLSPGVLRYGQWLVGCNALSNGNTDHFVISHSQQTGSPALLFRADGGIWLNAAKAVTSGAPPRTFALDPNRANTDSTINGWIFGEHPNGCFVLQRGSQPVLVRFHLAEMHVFSRWQMRSLMPDAAFPLPLPDGFRPTSFHPRWPARMAPPTLTLWRL